MSHLSSKTPLCLRYRVGRPMARLGYAVQATPDGLLIRVWANYGLFYNTRVTLFEEHHRVPSRRMVAQDLWRMRRFARAKARERAGMR